MKLLEDRILKDGVIINNDILKVDSFLNHQIDVALTRDLARCENIKIDYVGKVLKENCFLVGYGLDYNELERNVPYVYIAKPEDIDKWNEEIQK